MAKNGFKVLDSDMHLLEPVDLWERYIDEEFKDRAPKGLARTPLDLSVEVGGRVGPNILGRSDAWIRDEHQRLIHNYVEEAERGFDAQAQLNAMGKEGIDATVLYPSRGLFANSYDDMEPEFSLAIAQAYNNWLSDFCQAGDPGRMFGAAMVPIHDVEASVKEARRAVVELGFKAVFIRPNPPRQGVYYHHRAFDPLWTEIESLGVALGFHEGVASYMPTVGTDRFGFDEFSLQHACSHSFEQMLAVSAMTLGGVLERFPKMRVAFLEGNGSWLPFWLWRLDEHWELSGRYERPELKSRPSEYFYRQCYVSLECDETPAKQAIEVCGNDCFVFSTDFPHVDAKYPEATARFLELPISHESKQKILWDNCARLYNL